MDDADFERLLPSLPYSAGGLPVGYYNGAIFDKKCGRVVEPDLRRMPKLICDETNYLKNENGGNLKTSVLMARFWGNSSEVKACDVLSCS